MPAKWQWKLKQLTYTSALAGRKKYGRARGVTPQYAIAADAANESKVGDALRIRVQRHQTCEDIALDGFAARQRVPDSQEIAFGHEGLRRRYLACPCFGTGHQSIHLGGVPESIDYPGK